MIFPINKSTISHSLKSTLLFFTFVFFFECSAQTDILGCIDSTACNYNVEATVDDGTCDFCSCSGGTWFETSEVEYGVEIETIAEHSAGDLSGMTTYRLYLTVPSENDEIINFTGNDEFALSLATTTSFYQEPLFGGVTPANVSSAAISFIPNLAYDSWITIGLDGSAVAPEADVSLLPGPWASTFENGESFTIDDGVGSGWYILPGAPNGVAGSDLRVLFAQLTTDGIISGSFRSQVFPEGDQINDVRPDIEFLEGNSDNICGCMDDAACNYNLLADYDDASCEYSDSFYDCNGVCLTDLDECGVCGGSGISEGDCNCDGEQLDVIGVCGGSCMEDIDSDGVCDDIDECIGDYDSCGVCNGPGAIYECGCAELPSSDCDCGGIQLDALNICGGDCDDDLDDDGVCDDVDDCVGEYDSCGVCNGPGDVYECGCANIPEGYCNCDGEQLDVLGECGGSCTEDIDSDGVCDDIDDCVGQYDSCEVCNGPGTIYECGCADIPEGDCNCNGEQLDVIGVCGGSCSEDIDSDGVCDDVDDCIGEYDSCGVCNGPGDVYECGCTELPEGDCNCNGEQLDILGECGGSCTEDIDSDGVCDDIDDCVGQYDSCEVCNGPGAIYECGCAELPEGDCNCNGEQLDVIGVCGGSCTEDIDSDGVCDDVDDCIGEYDSCGVCNGPGDVYECGCAELPEGDCNCNGGQLDVLGECGGSCTADIDSDGVCDDIDDCVGEYDSCGVCNGPGTIYECGCAELPEGDCNCNGEQLDECGVCNGPGAIYECGCAELPEGDCNCNGEQLDILGECGGSCTEDIDSDGVCDDIDDCVGEYDSCGVCNGPGDIYECGCAELPEGDCNCNGEQLDECGVCNGPGAIYECGCAELPEGDCNCNGEQLDILGECGGSCTEDIDSDGVCDDIDDCVGEYDSCGVCNGPGDIYECGCSELPEGDCNCNGEQLDVIGVCGGSCTEDIDSDGVCDDVDDCVGNYDSCGVCNGPGDIYECGCADIPEGDCNCNGEQLDVLGECGGDCTEDDNENGICDIDEYGCTDSSNPNFNPNAAFDDGSCFIGGCISENACNYNPEAEYQIFGACDFTSCLGCIDTEACNYNPTASIDNGSCNYANLNYNCDGLCINDTDSDNICDENEIEGCTDVSNPGYDPYATDDDGSCLIGGCTLPIACNYDSSADYLDITLCDFNFCLGCMDPNACNYNPEATLSSPATCTFPPVPFRDCNGICDNDSDGDGICDEQEIDGCTDIQAVNFNPNATDDNGSCVIQVGGCILPFACNYDPLADYYLPGSCDFSCLGG